MVVVRIKELLPHAVAVEVGAAASLGFLGEGSPFFLRARRILKKRFLGKRGRGE